ncbi:CHASE2 domain-containing protein [Candidatus Pelagibacter sp.]|nr:CHASE2 domain-containing protein [Candidatus Pelagibacter sp.]
MFKKYKNFIILIFCSILLIVLKISNINIIKKISLINYDFYQKILVKGEVKNITIIDIDEKSIAAIGQFPWRRDVYAKILSQLNQYNPASVAFDIFFSEEDKQNPKNLLIELKKNNNISENIEVLDTNKIFIDEIKKTKAILPVVGVIKKNIVINNSKPKLRIISKGSNPKNYLFKFNGKITSLEKINNAATGIGSISLLPGIDGIIRSVPILLNIDDQIWPSLSLESIRVSNDQKNLLIETNDTGIQSIKTRKNIFTTDNNGIINIKYKDFKKDNYISAIDIINNNFDKNRIENKIILIGSSAQGLFDIVKISNGRVVPGVEVHAHIINNILTDDSIKKNLFTNSIENILLITVLVMLVLLPSKTKPKYSILFFIGCLIIINLISIILFYQNLYIDSLYSSICGTLIFTVSLYFRYLDENSIALENEKKQLVLKKEREIAGEVQKKLFPVNKEIEKYVFAKNTPAKDVSGDYYDYYKVNDNEFFFTLADVSGKGIKAGILMANAASVFRSLAKMNSSLSKTAMYINNQVKDSSYQSMFITAVIGKINIEKKEMEYVNIGHEPMMVLDASFDFKYLDATLPPLGMMMIKNEDHFKTTTMDIADKTILIYTDGLTEGYINNKEELTVTGFENEIKKIKSTDPKEIIEHVSSILTKDLNELRDDITCLGIHLPN